MKYRAEVEAVQWKDTDESWDEVVELYQGVETVAFRTDDGGLSVETEDGREQVPIGYWVVKNGMGVISLVAPDEFNLLSDADRVVRPTRAGSQLLADDALVRSRCRPADRRPESLRPFRCSPCRSSP